MARGRLTYQHAMVEIARGLTGPAPCAPGHRRTPYLLPDPR